MRKLFGDIMCSNSAMASYDINKSKVSEDKLAEFIMSIVDPDLKCVPGIGPKSVEKLNEAGIENTYQLIGKFLMICSPNKTPHQICQDFYDYIAKDVGINAYRSGVVTSIAERVNTMIPGICEMSALRGDDDDMMM